MGTQAIFNRQGREGWASELGTGAIMLLAGATGAMVPWPLVVLRVGDRIFDIAEFSDHKHLYLDPDFCRFRLYGDRLAGDFDHLGSNSMDRVSKLT